MKTVYIASINVTDTNGEINLLDSIPCYTQEAACRWLINNYAIQRCDWSKVLITRLEATESRSMDLEPYNPTYPFEE